MTEPVGPMTTEDMPRVHIWTAWLLLVRNQMLGFFREPAAAGFNLAVPFFILLIQATAFGDVLVGDQLPDYRVVDTLPVAAAVMFVMIIGVFGMGIGLASMIEARTIAVYRLRPGGLGAILSAYGTTLLVSAVVGLSASIAVLHLFWSIRSPRDLVVFAITVLLGFWLFLALGALIAAISGSPRAAQGVSSALFFPMLFLSGAVFPLDTFPQGLRTVAALLPGKHLYECLAFGWISNHDSFPWWSALYLVAFAVIGSVAATNALGRREQL